MATLPVPPIIAGYSFDRSPNLADAGERARLSPSSIKAFLNIAKKWELSEAQARGLLGGIASSTFHAWKTEPRGRRLDQDTLTRISLVIGIYKALHIYSVSPGRIAGWRWQIVARCLRVRLPSTICSGRDSRLTTWRFICRTVTRGPVSQLAMFK